GRGCDCAFDEHGATATTASCDLSARPSAVRCHHCAMKPLTSAKGSAMRKYIRRQVAEYQESRSWERAFWLTWRIVALFAIAFVIFIVMYAVLNPQGGNCGC